MARRSKREFDSGDGDEEEGAPAWLSSYSDMMTDLLAIFVILFSFAMMAVAQQNQTMRSEMEEASQIANAPGGQYSTQGQAEAEEEFDKIFQSIKEKISQSEFADSITVEKEQGSMTFRFRDSVLFLPDSPVMREASFEILQYMGDLLLGVQDDIRAIEINGHTAKVGEDSKTNFFAWELSSDRAIAVLQFFVTRCDLPQSKMIVSGYAHYNPIAENDNEEDRSQNRRVEVKILYGAPPEPAPLLADSTS